MDTPTQVLSTDANANANANTYDSSFIENVRNQIEKMDKTHHIEILKILKKFKHIKLNENKSGVFVNMSFLSKEIIDEIVKYLNYIKEQESYILKIENEQESLKTFLSN